MPDPFDQRLRAALGAAADALRPASAPAPDAADRLVATIHRRRHRRHRVAQSAAAVVAVIVGLGLAYRGGTSSNRRLQVSAAGSGHAATSASDSPNGGTTSATTQVLVTVPVAGCDPTPCAATPGPGTTGPAAGRPTPAVVPRTAPSTTAAPPRATTVAPTTTSVAGMVVVTEAATGTTVTLRAGQGLRVVLTGSAAFPWSQPVGSDPAVLQPRPSGVMPTVGSAIAQYVGASTGQATVTATQDPICRQSSPPCMVATRAFILTVVVG